MNHPFYQTRISQRGMFLLEVLISIAFISLTFVAITQSASTIFQTSKRVERETRGYELARARLEEIAAMPTASVTSALNGNSYVTENNIRFLRQTLITVNADNSRTVTVQVWGGSGKGGGATLTQVLAELGNT